MIFHSIYRHIPEKGIAIAIKAPFIVMRQGFGPRFVSLSLRAVCPENLCEGIHLLDLNSGRSTGIAGGSAETVFAPIRGFVRDRDPEFCL
jgi:hypothetical protein